MATWTSAKNVAAPGAKPAPPSPGGRSEGYGGLRSVIEIVRQTKEGRVSFRHARQDEGGLGRSVARITAIRLRFDVLLAASADRLRAVATSESDVSLCERYPSLFLRAQIRPICAKRSHPASCPAIRTQVRTGMQARQEPAPPGAGQRSQGAGNLKRGTPGLLAPSWWLPLRQNLWAGSLLCMPEHLANIDVGAQELRLFSDARISLAGVGVAFGSRRGLRRLRMLRPSSPVPFAPLLDWARTHRTGCLRRLYSTENWRSDDEAISSLMRLLRRAARSSQ